jgi:transposase-like protein
MGIKFCPNCGSEEIMLAAGGITGGFVCKNCGFSGSIFPEKIITKQKANKKMVGK